jgi:hypothetical protein
MFSFVGLRSSDQIDLVILIVTDAAYAWRLLQCKEHDFAMLIDLYR